MREAPADSADFMRMAGMGVRERGDEDKSEGESGIGESFHKVAPCETTGAGGGQVRRLFDFNVGMFFMPAFRCARICGDMSAACQPQACHSCTTGSEVLRRNSADSEFITAKKCTMDTVTKNLRMPR
jgi:hypothetical protein